MCNSVPTTAEMAAASTLGTRSFPNPLNTTHAVSPNRTRGKIEMRGFVNMMLNPTGLLMARTILLMPKIAPIPKPPTGPSSNAPRMVGICRMVTFNPQGVGIRPMGVLPNKTVRAPRTPIKAIFRVTDNRCAPVASIVFPPIMHLYRNCPIKTRHDP